jgi:hypothetical protein
MESVKIVIIMILAMALVLFLLYLVNAKTVIKLDEQSYESNHTLKKEEETLHTSEQKERAIIDDEECSIVSEKHPVSIDEITSKIKENRMMDVHLVELLNSYEGSVDSVDEGLVEEVVIKKRKKCGAITRTYTTLKEFLDKKSEMNPMAFIKYEALKMWKRWV